MLSEVPPDRSKYWHHLLSFKWLWIYSTSECQIPRTLLLRANQIFATILQHTTTMPLWWIGWNDFLSTRDARSISLVKAMLVQMNSHFTALPLEYEPCEHHDSFQDFHRCISSWAFVVMGSNGNGWFDCTGVYVPQLAKLIFDNNKELSENNRINFKGFLLGNAMIDIPTFYQGNVEYTYHSGMISDEMYNKIKTVCNFNGMTDPRLSGSCSELLWPAQGLYNNIGRVDLYSIHAPVCLLYDRQPDTAEFTPVLFLILSKKICGHILDFHFGFGFQMVYGVTGCFLKHRFAG